MEWFRRGKKGIKAAGDKKDMPQGVWLKCQDFFNTEVKVWGKLPLRLEVLQQFGGVR